jgi:C-terminal processing protease CtpA/Prc
MPMPAFQPIESQLRPQLRPRPVPKPEPPPPPPPPAITHVAERPLPDDVPEVLAKYPDGYWKEYRPRRPDRFGLGIVFKPYGNGQVRVHQILKGGPADLSGQDIEENDWLYEIDRELVFKQSLSKIMRMLHGKRKGQPAFLGLRRGGREDLLEVKIVKGSTNVPRTDCGVGIVFKSDPVVGGWVRVAQVVPGGPADEAVKPFKGSEVMKANDRVLEVNGLDVARQQLGAWQHLLRGAEKSSCVITFADVHAELYTVHVRRGDVDREEVDPGCVAMPPPASEAPVRAQPRALAPDKKVIAHIAPVTCGISFVQKENEEVAVDHVARGGAADKLAEFVGEQRRGKSICAGDVVMEIDGRDVYKQAVEDWKRLVHEGRPGQKIRFKFKVPKENVTYEVDVKRALVCRPELSVGVSFQAGPDGSYVVSGVSPSGPAAGKVKPGDRLLEISKERLENGRCRQDCLRFLA